MAKHATDDLYALAMDDGGILHGPCAERLHPDGLPEGGTPVFFGDTWRADVSGICEACQRFVDPAD